MSAHWGGPYADLFLQFVAEHGVSDDQEEWSEETAREWRAVYIAWLRDPVA